ncbi:MAG: FKBP-type peptidyl-prolyl cis-trans isomerase [Treponema sp.]|jgi:FKBP-type peptidyl-prolyl cis-trans isomerase|nr:FKBP-type peptidyl-prolyl cis-trans isomerase [Treponema sp.]
MIRKVVFALLMSTVVLFACSAGGKSQGGEKKSKAAALPAEDRGTQIDADTSYSFGLVLALEFGLNQVKIDYDYDELVKGFKDAVEGAAARFSAEEALGKIQTAFTAAVERLKEENILKEAEYLVQNGARNGVTTTASGLQYEVIAEGTGPHPGTEDTVEVHYEGTLLDGTVFDSSYARGEPVTFPLNEVIRGWTEGIPLMTAGSTYRFVIPAALAYGEQGNGSIPPNSTLIFKVELLSIVE